MKAARSSVDQLADIGRREIAIAALLARVKTGELTRERLELAAYLGDPIARGALGNVIDRERDSLDVWCQEFRRLATACGFEWMAAMRASLAAAHEVFDAWHDSPARDCGCPADPGIHGCIPQPETVRDVSRVLDAAECYADEPSRVAERVWSNACNQLEYEDLSEWLPVPYVNARRYMTDVVSSADLAYEPHVRLAIRKDLVPWVLNAWVGPGFEIRGRTGP